MNYVLTLDFEAKNDEAAARFRDHLVTIADAPENGVRLLSSFMDVLEVPEV